MLITPLSLIFFLGRRVSNASNLQMLHTDLLKNRPINNKHTCSRKRTSFVFVVAKGTPQWTRHSQHFTSRHFALRVTPLTSLWPDPLWPFHLDQESVYDDFNHSNCEQESPLSSILFHKLPRNTGASVSRNELGPYPHPNQSQPPIPRKWRIGLNQRYLTEPALVVCLCWALKRKTVISVKSHNTRRSLFLFLLFLSS